MTADASSLVALKPHRGQALLRLIGIFKLLKGLGLIAAALAVWHLVHKDLGEEIRFWAERFHLAPGNKYVVKIFEKASKITHRQLRIAGAVLMGYAAMFLTEGVGLLLLQSWAEWMVVITTCGLIPFEVYELLPHEHPSVLKASALLVNVAIGIYLFFHVRHEGRQARHQFTAS